MVGNALGHFLANFDQFQKAGFDDKLTIIRDTALPFATLLGRKLINLIPCFKNTVLGSFFRNGFLVVSIFELCRNISEVFFSDVLNLKEKLILN